MSVIVAALMALFLITLGSGSVDRGALTYVQVLHVRNLPPDATEQDVIDLCKPFGRIVKTKISTGNAKTQANQAFIEFENVNCAMRMIFSFVGSADPPKVSNYEQEP